MTETTTITVTLPAVFYEDHISRELPGGELLKQTKRSVTVRLTAEDWDELLSDARYYSTDWVHMGREYFGLGRSAQATVTRLLAAGRPGGDA